MPLIATMKMCFIQVRCDCRVISHLHKICNVVLLMFPGGDDCNLNTFDIRMGPEPIRKNSKFHSAGVTSMASGLPNPHHFMTGSYDDRLRLFDTRTLSRPVQEINLEGGIWRIKLNPVDPDLILCACMYNNFSIVSYKEDIGFSLEGVLQHGDDKICYGADWGRPKALTKSNSYTFAACSFYDKLFSVNAFKSNQ